MESSLLKEAMVQLAMGMQCASNDFHCMHFNVHGTDYDNMHANVLKTYYEQAADDFDELCEKAQMIGSSDVVAGAIPNPSSCTQIANYTAWEGNPCTREVAIERCNEVIKTICMNMVQVFEYCNKQSDAACIGIANYLAGRIEYWSKELLFFNRMRGEL